MSEIENITDPEVQNDDEEMPIENIAPSNENNVAQHHGNEFESETTNESETINESETTNESEKESLTTNESENESETTNESENENEEAPLPSIVFKYRCYPLSSFKKATMAETHPASLILPIGARHIAARLNAPCPLAFQVQNIKNGQTTVCGVSEFTDNQRKCYVPDWIMENLGLKRDQNILVTYVKLPLGETVLFQAQSVDFLEVSDPKKVLQCALAKFHCISKDDIIPISDDGKVYKMKVLKTQPPDSICIRDIDLKVHFDPPVGYVEPKKENPMEMETEVEAEALPEPHNTWEFLSAKDELDEYFLEDSEDDRLNEILQPLKSIAIIGTNLQIIEFDGQIRYNVIDPNASHVPEDVAFSGTGYRLGGQNTPKPSPNISPEVVQKLTASTPAGLGEVIEHLPPEFDPSDEPPSKRQKITDDFSDEDSSDSDDVDMDNDDDDSDYDPNVQ